jgi:NADH dehydrogenase FAD-containing subunit
MVASYKGKASTGMAIGARLSGYAWIAVRKGAWHAFRFLCRLTGSSLLHFRRNHLVQLLKIRSEHLVGDSAPDSPRQRVGHPVG